MDQLTKTGDYTNYDLAQALAGVVGEIAILQQLPPSIRTQGMDASGAAKMINARDETANGQITRATVANNSTG
jgi:hypothetical protein